MTEAYIVDAVRTPVGKRGGALAGVHSADLGAHSIGALMRRTGVDPGAVAQRDRGLLQNAAEVVPAGHREVAIVDRPGEHLDEHLAGARRGVGRLLEVELVEAVGTGGKHPGTHYDSPNFHAHAEEPLSLTKRRLEASGPSRRALARLGPSSG